MISSRGHDLSSLHKRACSVGNDLSLKLSCERFKIHESASISALRYCIRKTLKLSRVENMPIMTGKQNKVGFQFPDVYGVIVTCLANLVERRLHFCITFAS